MRKLGLIALLALLALVLAVPALAGQDIAKKPTAGVVAIVLTDSAVEQNVKAPPADLSRAAAIDNLMAMAAAVQNERQVIRAREPWSSVAASCQRITMAASMAITGRMAGNTYRVPVHIRV